jgi:putative hydroxymethylpyrimidine transport system substrate-binding protein
MPRIGKFFRLALTVGTVTALLVGCGNGSDAETAGPPPERLKTFQTVKVTLDAEAGPETAGILTANSLGYFSELGLGVETYAPLDPTRPVTYVVDETADLAVTHEPQAVLAREKGAPIVAIGSLVPEPTLSMIWLEKSEIDDIADLKGKTIALPGAPFQRDFLEVALARAGLKLSDVKVKKSNYQLVPDLIKGRVDAIFGGSRGVEGAELESQGLEPIVVEAEELGIPPYDELVVIARKDRVAANPKLFRVFMEAVSRGVAAAIEDPESAAGAIAFADETEFHPKPTEAGLEATLPLLSKTGRIDPGQARNLIAWMHEEGMIERKLPVSTLLAQP